MYIVIYKNITQYPSNLCVTQHEIIDEKKRRFSKCRLSISVRSSFFCGAVFSCLYVRPNLVVCSLSSTAAWAPGMTSARPTSDTRGWHRPADRGHPTQTQRWGLMWPSCHHDDVWRRKSVWYWRPSARWRSDVTARRAAQSRPHRKPWPVDWGTPAPLSGQADKMTVS